ncbi:hypothetical protein [Kitasatospora sp. NBC_01300]|uniref:hypothetical protein n=1 Tax=Kitasatospora sp. NBC_01300 TaxID=2903574 RepID=UPI002F90C662|nr:hypothetical protein OG556_40770 [Kitasatospora sp. NBC_01300]
MLALQIDPAGPVDEIELPDDPALLRRVLTTRLGGSPDPGYYHRRALMWLHGNAANEGLPPNVVATALASAWRGMDIGASYFLHGRVIVTGAADGDADHLEEKLAGQAREVGQVVADRTLAWRTAPPASNEAAWEEIVRAVLAPRPL